MPANCCPTGGGYRPALTTAGTHQQTSAIEPAVGCTVGCQGWRALAERRPPAARDDIIFAVNPMPKSKQPLSITHPEIAAQWHAMRNGDLLPEAIVAGSSKKVWWTCPKGPDHEWQATVDHRVHRFGHILEWRAESLSSAARGRCSQERARYPMDRTLPHG